jgi:hypothetical protein
LLRQFDKTAGQGGYMKKTWTKWILAAVMITTIFPLTGLANGRGRGVNNRQHKQQHRIREGVRSGELTRREAARLQAREARIRVNEAYARRSGGTFTLQERLRIQRQLNRASRDIYRQKHDNQDRD